MRKKTKRIGLEERKQIQQFLLQKLSISKIAKNLERSYVVIQYEIIRVSPYDAEKAHENAVLNNFRKGRTKSSVKTTVKVGEIYGSITILKYISRLKNKNKHYYLVRCGCGQQYVLGENCLLKKCNKRCRDCSVKKVRVPPIPLEKELELTNEQKEIVEKYFSKPKRLFIGKYVDFSGQKFGHWTVKKRVSAQKKQKRMIKIVLCEGECGHLQELDLHYLRYGIKKIRCEGCGMVQAKNFSKDTIPLKKFSFIEADCSMKDNQTIEKKIKRMEKIGYGDLYLQN